MLTIKGTVGSVIPTPKGEWFRVIVQATGRTNDLVMVRKDTAAKIQAGQTIELPVRAQVDTNAEGRPTRNIVFFHADPASDGARRPAAAAAAAS